MYLPGIRISLLVCCIYLQSGSPSLFVCLSIYLSVHLSACVSTSLALHLSISLSLELSVCRSVGASLFVSACRTSSLCLSFSLCLSLSLSLSLPPSQSKSLRHSCRCMRCLPDPLTSQEEFGACRDCPEMPGSLLPGHQQTKYHLRKA